MAKASGKTCYVEFNGTALWVSSREFSVTEEQNTADATAGADVYENMVLTTKKISAGLKLVMLTSATGGAIIATRLRPGNTFNLLWGFEGNTAGSPKGGFLAIVKKFNRSAPYDGVIAIDVEFEMAGETLLFDDSIAKW